MKTIQISILAGSMLAVTSGVYAQETSSEIIVTANRLPQIETVTMAGTTIITEEEIRRSLAKTLVELLLGQAGVQMAQSGGRGAQTSLFLRGTESDHTLILVDGTQITTSTGSAGRLENISLAQIERIEIVRGPRSSVYGSEAIGGVINIITRKGGDKDFSSAINLSTGTEKSRDVDLDLAGRIGDTVLSLSYSHGESDGIDFSQSGDPDDDGFRRDAIALSGTHFFTEEMTFTLNLSGYDARSDYDDGTVDTENRQVSAIFNLPISDSWDSTLTMDRFEEDSQDNGAFGNTNSLSTNTSLRWQNTLASGSGQTVSFGLDGQRQELEYDTFGASQSSTRRDDIGIYGVYLGETSLADITLSLRNDDNETFGNYTTGSIAVGRSFSDTLRAWVSYGTAFKAPNLIDLYVNFPSFNFFANPDLEPETAQNIEAGIELSALSARWEINLFHNEIDDLISTDATFTTLANVNEAQIDGLEIVMETDLAGWELDLSVTLLDHEDKGTGERLLRRPDQSLTATLYKESGNFDLTIQTLAQSDHRDIDPVTFGSSEVAGYGILNLIGGYRFSENADVRLRIGNVFDKDYEVVDGFNSYGTTATVAFAYRF